MLMRKAEALVPSLWAATAVPAQAYAALEGETRADAVVIGGGFTGLSASLHLAEAGAEVALLEAAEIGWGASGRNGGQVIPGLKHDPDVLEAMFGPDLGPRLVKTVGGAADLVFSLVEQHGIACDAVRKGWIQPAHTARALETVRRRAESWSRYGADVAQLSRDEVRRLVGAEGYLGGWIDRRGGGIQPLSYARGLAKTAAGKGVRLYERSPALRAERTGNGWRIATPRGAVIADAVVIGTNGYTDGLWPGLRRSVMPVYSFQIATRPLSDNLRRTILPEGQVASDTRRLLLYYRLDAQGRLLMGGRGPFKETPGPEDAARLRQAVRRLFPQLDGIAWEFHWSGRVALTADHLPHLHELAPGVHAGLGFNGRGVAMGTMMGRFLAARALGKEQAEIAFPITPLKRIPLHGFYRLPVRLMTGYYRLRDALEGS
ncbi:MAG TPA: FAD-binding oxidoreductase [Alphaproteobacteria bacterium]|nr:FAD-binding oxidoreductase [Alphaproteobacteria bacterium]